MNIFRGDNKNCITNKYRNDNQSTQSYNFSLNSAVYFINNVSQSLNNLQGRDHQLKYTPTTQTCGTYSFEYS